MTRQPKKLLDPVRDVICPPVLSQDSVSTCLQHRENLRLLGQVLYSLSRTVTSSGDR